MRADTRKRGGLLLGGMVLAIVVAYPFIPFSESVAFKGVIWKSALDSVPVKAPYRAVLPAIFIGFLLNTVLIARLVNRDFNHTRN